MTFWRQTALREEEPTSQTDKKLIKEQRARSPQGCGLCLRLPVADQLLQARGSPSRRANLFAMTVICGQKLIGTIFGHF